MNEPKYIVYKDNAGEYRWRLKAGNGEIVADSSEGYSTKANAIAGAQRTKELSAAAQVYA